MIDLSTPQKHKLTNLGVLSQKNRKPDENPGAQLMLASTMSLEIAEKFFPGVTRMLFEAKPGKQGALDGMSLQQVNEVGKQIGWITWTKEYTGHTLTIDFGLGDVKSNPVIADCKLNAFRFKPDEGSIQCRYKAESNDVSEALFGKLAKLKACDVNLLITPPAIDDSQQKIPDTDPDAAPATKARKPGAAERAAVAKTKPTKAEARQTAEDAFAAGGDADKPNGKVELSAEAAWPFPKGDKPSDDTPPPQSVTIERSQPGTRTARGRDKTREALSKGAPQ